MGSNNDNDIVFHKDILSSPAKSLSKSPIKNSLSSYGKKHRTNKRKLLEVVLSPKKAIVETHDITVSKVTDKHESVLEVKRKRGRPRKVKELSINSAPNILDDDSTSSAMKTHKSVTKSANAAIKNGAKEISYNKTEESNENFQKPSKRKFREEIVKSSKKPVKSSKDVIKLDLSKENILPEKSRRKRTKITKNVDVSSDDEIYSSDDESFQEADLNMTQEDEDDDEEEYNKEDQNVQDDGDIVKEEINDEILDESNLVKKHKRKYTKRKKNEASKDEFFNDGELIENENTLLEPKTPRKEISTNYDFISPLKKTIMESLKQYDSSSKNIKLNKNFKPTPLPSDYDYKPSNDYSKLSTYLDTFEGFLDQKRTTNFFKKSTNSMTMAPHVSRDEFGLVANTFNKFFLNSKRNKILELQEKMFSQYWFELSQGFNLLFYGVGSKRNFMEKFAIDYLSPKLKKIQLFENTVNYDGNIEHEAIPCIIINGYNPSCNYRDVYKDISNILITEEITNSESKYWGNHIILQISKLIEFYKTQSTDIKLILVVHNIDGPSIRKDAFQTMLSLLATIRQVAIVASTDHVYTPIIWNNIQSQNYNFIYHDVTNYEPYSVELSFQDVMKVGDSEKSQGSEGAKYVLQSLTANSKKMFKLLVESQMGNIEKATKKVSKKRKASLMFGVEFKQFSHLCATEFIASNDISLRTMLREFIEHNMASLSKTNDGTEFVWIPYNYLELKKLKETVLVGIE